MSEHPLGNLITYNPTALHQETLLEDVFEWFDRDQIRHLPVVDEERRVVGMLSLTDVHWAMSEDAAAGSAAAGESTPGYARRELLVRDVMVTDVHTVDAQADPMTPLGLILKHGVSSIPVIGEAGTDREGRLTGTISSTDYLREFSDGDHDSFREPVSKYMLPEIAQIDLATSANEALRIMTEQEWENAAVTTGDCPVGILSRRDFCGAENPDGSLHGVYQPDVPTVRGTDLLGEVVWHMIESLSPALAVVDRGNRMDGLLTQDRVLRLIATELEAGATV